MNLIPKKPLWRLLLAGAIILVALFFVLRPKGTKATGTTFAARRGPLQIAVLEGGSVEALESQEIRSQIKGYQGTKILSIVEEGYLVTEDDIKNGKVLVELDSSDLRERLTTQEIQFQSTLSGFIEARQAYDIQLNQNRSDLKDAEQKSRFARMDVEKFMGVTLAQQIFDKLGLKETPFTNEVDMAALEAAALQTSQDTSSSWSVRLMNTNQAGAPGVNPGGQQPSAARMQRSDAPQTNGAPAGETGERPRQRRPRPEGAGAPPQGGMPPATNAPIALLSAKPDVAPAPAKAPTKILLSDPDTGQKLDFSQYAKEELLGDGSARQQLRKLQDDLLVATQEMSVAQIHLQGTKRLLANNFVTKNEYDSELLTIRRNEIKVQSAQTALDLFIKYEFVKSAEEFVSKYDETLRLLDRARKEAISKLAQARARLKSAEGRYRIEVEQRQELADQFSNCVIRALRPGLVVYGGSDERRFFGGEEQIREGATVRERQSIITIPDMTHMAVKVRIHESHIKKVSKGLKARITVDAFPDIKLEGEVIKVGVLPDSQNRWMNPDMKVYLTSVGVNGVYDWIKPGMSAKVEILVRELPDVVYVPIQAVSSVKGKQVCFVAHTGGADQREVEVGEFNDEFIEIKKGLKEGDKVLLRAPEGVETDVIAGGIAGPSEVAPDKKSGNNDSSRPALPAGGSESRRQTQAPDAKPK